MNKQQCHSGIHRSKSHIIDPDFCLSFSLQHIFPQFGLVLSLCLSLFCFANSDWPSSTHTRTHARMHVGMHTFHSYFSMVLYRPLNRLNRQHVELYTGRATADPRPNCMTVWQTVCPQVYFIFYFLEEPLFTCSHTNGAFSLTIAALARLGSTGPVSPAQQGFASPSQQGYQLLR